MSIGKRIENLRDMKGISQKELSKILDIHPSVMNRIELGTRPVRNDEIVKIATYFDITTDELLGNKLKVNRAEAEISRRNKIVTVPVLGNIPAGVPIEAIENIEDYEEIVVPNSAEKQDYFCLKVKGDSMTPDIGEGDVVVLRKQSSVDSGDVAAVIINGNEATLKRVDIFPNGIMLVPFNRNYESKFYSPEEIEQLPIKILGKVIELRRKF